MLAGGVLATGDGRAEDPKETKVLKAPAAALVISDDGKTLITAGSDDGKYRIWDLAEGKETKALDAPKARLFQLALSPDGQTLATVASNDKFVQIWDLPEGKPRSKLSDFKGTALGGLAFAGKGKSLVTGNDFDLKIWDPATGKKTAGAAIGASPLAVSPDGDTIATVAGDELKLWSTAAKPKATVKLKERPTAIAFTPDGTALILAARRAQSVTVWDLKTKKERASLKVGADVLSIAVSPDGKTLAVGLGFREDAVQLWNLEEAKLTLTFKVKHEGVPAIGFTPDGKTLVTGGNAIKIWEMPAN
jgi:WD40 repeat protein